MYKTTTVVNWGKMWFVNFNASINKLLSINHLKVPFLTFISMSDASLQKRDSLRLLGLLFSADMRWKDYTESIARSAAKKVGSLCRARQFFLSSIYLTYAFVYAYYISFMYGPMPLLFSWSSSVRFKEESGILLGLISRLSYRQLPTPVWLPLCAFFINTFMDVFRWALCYST